VHRLVKSTHHDRQGAERVLDQNVLSVISMRARSKVVHTIGCLLGSARHYYYSLAVVVCSSSSQPVK